MINSQILYLLIFTNFVFFCFGMVVCFILRSGSTNNINDMVSISSRKQKRNNQSVEKPETIEIDDTKYVSKINTNNLEKKYESLGKTKSVENDTASSINKLKNLKG